MIFIMLTRLIGKEVHPDKLNLEDLKQEVEKNITASCPDVEWLSNYAVFGPYDYVDIFSAPNLENAMKVAAIVRFFGHASTEIWPALEWDQFKKTISALPEEKSFSKNKTTNKKLKTKGNKQ
jgi:uncharacterized protein with GYD domain